MKSKRKKALQHESNFVFIHNAHPLEGRTADRVELCNGVWMELLPGNLIIACWGPIAENSMTNQLQQLLVLLETTFLFNDSNWQGWSNTL